MSKDYIIESIFPTPVYFSKLDIEILDKEKTFFKENLKDVKINAGNIASMNSYVLNNKKVKRIKSEIEKHIMIYHSEVLRNSKTLIPYITQSWLNSTKINQFHHTHNHSNSYYSGVFYLEADGKVDQITFQKSYLREIQVIPEEYNYYNSDTWWFPTEKNNIIIFPSNTVHSVNQKKDDNERISLAFNVFLKGKLGSEVALTELIV